MPAPKKTSEAKISGGASRSSRINPDKDLKFESVSFNDFKPPDYIKNFPEAFAIWNKQLPRLLKAGSIRLEDTTCFEFYCLNSGIVARESLVLIESEEDEIYTTKSGNLIPHPRRGVINTAQKNAMACIKELGLTPASRGRVGITPIDRDDNPFAEAGL